MILCYRPGLAPCLGLGLTARATRLPARARGSSARPLVTRGLVANTGAVIMTTFDVFLSVLLPTPSPALPEAMAGATNMGGYLATARATQLVDIVR